MDLKGIRVITPLALLTVISACVGENQAAPQPAAVEKGGDERTGQYDAVENWWKAAPDHDETWTWGLVAGVAVDHPDRIVVVTWGDSDGQDPPFTPGGRHTNFIVVADRNGNIVEQWSQWDSILTRPHQVYISPYDPERHVWVVDNGGENRHQILKFSNDGRELVMRLGDLDHPTTREEARANPRPGPHSYGWPSTLAFLPNGDFLLADGYWNSRVIRYDSDGEYIMEWGELGSGPGQFDLLHGTAVDRDGRVYVADRTNSRIQVFFENGEFIEEWPNIHDPVNVYIDENDWVWVLSASHNRILKYNRSGEFQYGWGVYGPAAGGFEGGLARPHQMAVDQEGSLFIANYDGGWVNKFVPKSGADRSKLVGQIIPLTP